MCNIENSRPVGSSAAGSRVIRRCLQYALVVCLLVGAASSVGAAPILLNFEGLQNLQQIGNFYNGGAGGN